MKYVGIIFDEYLNFQRHIKILNAKLKRANNLIAISRHYLTHKLLLQIYYGQFYSHLTYGCQLWGQNENALEQTISQQNKAVRLISFAHYQADSNPLFKNLKLLKLTDIVKYSNILFTHNTINNNSPRTFQDYFIFNEINHQHQTVNSLSSIYSIPAGSLKLPIYRSNSGLTSIKYICSSTWNSTLKNLSLENLEEIQSKSFLDEQNQYNKLKIHTEKAFPGILLTVSHQEYLLGIKDTPLFRSFSIFF